MEEIVALIVLVPLAILICLIVLFARGAGQRRQLAALRAEVSAVSVDEATTKAEIAHAHAAWGRIVCPHTAVALSAARRLDRNGAPIVALSTAHPSKFGAFVSDVLGFEPEATPVIRALGEQPERLTIIDNTAEAALAAVKGFAS